REVLPAELAEVHRLELCAQRNGVVVVREYEGLPGSELAEGTEDLRVALLARQAAHVEVPDLDLLGARGDDLEPLARARLPAAAAAPSAAAAARGLGGL